MTTDMSAPIIPPPPGFRQFSWPREDWKAGGDPSLFTFTKELPGWFPWSSVELPVDLPSLPLLPIGPDSLDDSVTASRILRPKLSWSYHLSGTFFLV